MRSVVRTNTDSTVVIVVTHIYPPTIIVPSVVVRVPTRVPTVRIVHRLPTISVPAIAVPIIAIVMTPVVMVPVVTPVLMMRIICIVWVVVIVIICVWRYVWHMPPSLLARYTRGHARARQAPSIHLLC